jgi:glycerophosphoryl diester phosphodiesterase
MDRKTLRRVGHKGADLIVPGNTLASFDAALAAGVDMIEFDVLPDRGGERLLLAHDYEDAGSRAPDTLEQGLEHLASAAFAEVDFDIDLKLPGYELRVVDALRRHGLLGRSLISSFEPASLAAIRAHDPSIRLGWSVPKLTRDPFASPLMVPGAYVAAAAYRAALPLRAGRAIRARRVDAVMSHWRLVSPALVRAVQRAGGELYVWTVDELPRIRALHALGVTGVITNDPRLFSALAA